MSEADSYYEEEAAPSSSLPRPRGRVDKWMAICWGISLASFGLILALATVIVLFVTEPEDEAVGFELAVETVQQKEVEQKEVRQKQLEQSASSSSQRNPIAVDLSLNNMKVEALDFTVGMDKGVADIGNVGAAVGNLDLGLDMGSMQMVGFLGTKAKGNRFAFLIDYSKSMRPDQLKVMKQELTKTLSTFNGSVQVSLIFFSGPAFIAGEDANQIRSNWENPGGGFHNYVPKKGWKPPVPKWIACTTASKSKLTKHIYGTPTTGGTDWRNPFRMAYSMNPRPHVIFFMTDGATKNPQETVDMVKKNRAIQVNSIAFGIPNNQAEAPMKEMAKATSGTFKSYSKDEIAKMAAKIN